MCSTDSIAEAFFQPSDEEVLGYNSLDEGEDELDEGDGVGDPNDYGEDDGVHIEYQPSTSRNPYNESTRLSEENEAGIAAWGSSKKSYYNADVIETEADALEEEEEATRIQMKRLKSMKEKDFGFDETDWLESDKISRKRQESENGVVTEILPQLNIAEDMTIDERLKILRSRYPEFEPLAKDFVNLQPTYDDLKDAANTAQEALQNRLNHTVVITQFRALSAYLGAISMYFVLLTSPSQTEGEKTLAMAPTQLREHPIMQTLVNCRQLWERVRNLSSGILEVTVENKDFNIKSLAPTLPKAWKMQGKHKKKEAPPKKDLGEPERSETENPQARPGARCAENIRQAEVDLANLSKLLTDRNKTSKIQKIRLKDMSEDSDFGDEDALTAREAEEKAKKKRSLRFYTSQIAQKANKRNAAGRDAGGDLDLPYRERLKDRQARLNAEAEKRGRKQANNAEDLGSSDEENYRLAGEVLGAPDSNKNEDEYYDMITARSKQRKADKKALAEAHAEASRKGGRIDIQEKIGPDGKRAITYQIEKNKGLTPKRNKDVRNPRVKKRKKFEQKKKRLGSIRQIYKGGEGPGGYGGELTGIKKNLVKSVKL
jgi:U3 small nucleolar RNA-associated protein 3